MTTTISDKAIENLKMGSSCNIEALEAAFAVGNYGDLMDYTTAEFIRKATREEAIESWESSVEGVITVDGRDCYVEAPA